MTDASVLLPVKNGGDMLRDCLAALSRQRFAGKWEILAIDSGSSDDSLRLLNEAPRVTIVQIEPGEFQHGRTRNLAMTRCTGDRALFLTQDAVPASDLWLASWIEFMDSNPEVAGAFGRQEPHADADPLEAWEVTQHFNSFRGGPGVFRAPPDGTEQWCWQDRARLHFFSNVNSCVNRWAWKRVPFPEIDFGEDQAWAHAVQRKAMATGYADRPAVRHSHNYDAWSLFRRRYDEARFMKRCFGYSLVPSLREAALHAKADQRAFEAVLLRLPQGQMARRSFRAATRAWASAAGRYAGTRLFDVDGIVHRVMSLTERNRRK